MATRRLLVGVFALLLLAAAIAIGGRVSSSRSTGTDPHGTALPATRQVELSFSMPSRSRSDGLHAKLESGTMPASVTSATVLSDEQCQPDANGVSHCLNRLRLADGSEIAVRHPHVMSEVPCLAPGERVQLVPA